MSARKERDRYRGRRRLPTPPRSRYATVATTAILGAGIVAAVAAGAIPDMKVSNPGPANLTGQSSALTTTRGTVTQRASRDETRTTTTSTPALDVWLLPMTSYTIGNPYNDASALDRGVDLLAPEGTPVYAAHGGTVTLARHNGGYGLTVIIDVGNGVQLVYGHASKLLVQEGQQVNSGDLIALTGNTGYAFESCVHFEIRHDGTAVDPIAYLSDQGVSLTKKTDSLS